MPLLIGSGGRFTPSKVDQRIKKGGEVFDVNVAQLPDEVEFSLGGNDLIFRDGHWSGLGSSADGTNLNCFYMFYIMCVCGISKRLKVSIATNP